RFKVRFLMDNIDEQIDAVSRAFLGLTASCARCHDHKFDPIPAADYYALAGIFTSTDLCAGLRNKMGGGGLDYYDTSLLISLNPEAKPDPAVAEKIEEKKKAAQAARAELVKTRDGLAKDIPQAEREKILQPLRQKANKAQAEFVALQDPTLLGPVAYGLRDGKQIGDTEIRVRGEAEKLGPKVPRGFLTTLPGGGPATIADGQSGRLELARWLTDPSNPLISRVMVNRVWHHLFGRGIVKTVDNFGVTGDLPTNPELLDHLSNQFIREGWSVKRLVRSIVLSHSYQLGADANPESVKTDPENRFVWRHSPRRLEAEEIRDATLAASGALSLAAPQGSLGDSFKVTELRNNGPEARALLEKARASTHRSVDLPLLRGIVPTSLEVFDFAEQGMVTGSRDATTVSPQALYLLNDPFVRRHALTLAERLTASTDLDDAQRIERAYALVLGRQPTAEEVDRATQYLNEYESIAAETFAKGPPKEVAEAGQESEAQARTTSEVKPAAEKKPEAPAQANGKKKGQGKRKKKQEALEAAQAAADAVKAAQGGAATEAKTTGQAKPKPPQPVNPDEADQTDTLVNEEAIQANDARTAAWASFVQALLGSAEFRYLK
ncbi:MAG: DUF1553 domain-containing protein, partial [Planctomycetaceae bacterium]|nr:DUF1553 domain-containing protein [Planctomycetaceae bacterium]